jgi:hypothetical protein
MVQQRRERPLLQVHRFVPHGLERRPCAAVVLQRGRLRRKQTKKQPNSQTAKQASKQANKQTSGRETRL